jgi:hypothetical protein
MLHVAPGLSRQLQLKLIENEIDFGLMFVEVAKSAYRAAKFSEGSSALCKAEAVHLQASHLADGLERQEFAFVEQKLRELQSAIDRLMTGDTD